MSAKSVLEQLCELGVAYRAVGGKVLLQPGSKAPTHLKDAVREHKQEIIAILTNSQWKAEATLVLLRNGQVWLMEQHQLWQSGESGAANDADFSRAWNGWWDLDHRLRVEDNFTGCIHGPNGVCPEGFPCLGCSEVSSSGGAAKLALVGAIEHREESTDDRETNGND